MLSLSNSACSVNNKSNLPSPVNESNDVVKKSSNPHVCHLLSHLRNETSRNDPWIANNFIAIADRFTCKKIDLDRLVNNIGFENAFALLRQCYKMGSQMGDDSSQKAAFDSGILLEQLADSHYNEYRGLDFANLEFCKDKIDPAFLQKLEGISSQRLVSSSPVNFSKIVIGALSVSAVAFAVWKILYKN